MSESKTKVADEILLQLGGGRFIAMTGSSHFAGCDEMQRLTMKLARNQGKATNLRITLEADDTYTMDWIKIVNPTKRNNFKGRLDVLKSVKGVYNSDLRRRFKEFTGLDTHL